MRRSDDRAGAPPERLPPPAEYRILHGWLGDLMLRPWFDGAALHAVARWIFPLSRGWAAACDGDPTPEDFAAALGLEIGAARRASGAIRTIQERAAAYREAAHHWEDGFFGPADLPTGRLLSLELARQGAAQEHVSSRLRLLPLRRRLPAVRWEMPSAEEVEARHGARLRGLAFPAPAPAEIAESRRVPGTQGMEHWLRFPSPRLGDNAWARVFEPDGVRDPATLIFLHGIGMEPELWRDLADPVVGTLVRRGIRVVRPEGPWHGRRELPGWSGGEPALGRAPLGFIDLFEAWVAEVAILIDWVRRTSSGPVAVGGVSLGALTSQLVGTAARDWSARLRPDALLLIATSGDMLEVALRGSLSRALGVSDRLTAAGWDPDAISPWLPLLEPRGAPGTAPERIVLVLGQHDTVCPTAGGLELARCWQVPEGNCFLRRQGHFSIALGLGRRPEPLHRLADLLTGS